MARPLFTKSVIARMIALKSKGARHSDIAAEIGSTANSVKVRMSQLGLTMHNGVIGRPERKTYLGASIPISVAARFEREAERRGKRMPVFLRELLTLIAGTEAKEWRDNLFDGIFCDDK